MAHKPPPVPAEQQNKHGAHSDKAKRDAAEEDGQNLRERGRQANIHQNTHNQGYQQDR
ncbi:MAG TPA: hypothetical protein VHT51_06705 [Micropepsaceae bacterium]|jgi:hypothetical protein|nr:hypothetical protein [Micropepsaceae bacterium]